jgi:uncharacterized membrane protein YgcG
MSRLGDYETEMQRSTPPDLDIERLLSGDTSLGEEAADLVVLVALMRAEGIKAPSEETVARVASKAASIARSTRTVGQQRPERRTAWRLQPQLAAIVGAILLVGVFSGVAMAADGAAPGDRLYGIDRALERVGIGAGGAEERLEEARTLLSEGEAGEAIRHVTEVLDDDAEFDVTEVRDALDDAATQFEADDEPGKITRREDVAILLDYLRANLGPDIGVDGKEFGQGVADLAHDIGPKDNAGPPSTNPELGNGNGNSGGNGNGNSGGNGNGNSGGNGHGGSGGDGQAPGNSGNAPGRGEDS